MSVRPTERYVQVAGGKCRILEKGSGATVGVLAGHNGLPRWTPFLDELAKGRRVVLLSPPGFPGSDAQHEVLDSHLDWLTATLDLLEAAGVAGADLVAASITSMLAWDVAALSPGSVRRLSLTAPYGVYVSSMPIVDVFAQTPDKQRELLSACADKYEAAFGAPEDPTEAESHELVMYRAATAGARLIWPFGDRGLAKRLHRVQVPVQLLWGDQDKVVPREYARVYSQELPKPAVLQSIAGAGHLAWIDRPAECAAAIEAFLSGQAR